MLCYDVCTTMPFVLIVQMDAYSKLGVSYFSSYDDVHQAYKSLVRKYHPDKPNGDTEEFRKIQHAYETIVQSNTCKDPIIEEIKEQKRTKPVFDTLVVSLDEVILGCNRYSKYGKLVQWFGYRNPEYPYYCDDGTCVLLTVKYPNPPSQISRKIHRLIAKVFRRYLSSSLK